MPLQAPGKQTVREALRGFFGVDLRSDPNDIQQGSVSKGVNVDLYETPGTIQSRRGIKTIFEIVQAPQRRLLRALNSLISIGANDLYVDAVKVSGGELDEDTEVSMVEYQGQNAANPEIFVANGAISVGGTRRMFVYDGEFRNWGIEITTVATQVAAGAAGSLTGDYNARYTWVRRVGSTIAHESNPAPADSAAVTLSSQTLDVTVRGSTDPDITGIRIYRTQAGGSVFLFDQEVPNVSATYNSSQADSALGAAVSEDNDHPQPATLVHALRDRLWTNDINNTARIRYTARFKPESQPADNFVDIGSESHTVTGLSSINGNLIVFTETTKFSIIEQLADVNAIGAGLRLVGSAVAGFLSIELPSSRGCVAPHAIVPTGVGIIYPTKEGVFITDGTAAPEQLVSGAIQSIFLGRTEGGISPIDFNKESNMTAALHRGRYYLSYTSTVSTDGKNDTTAILDINTGNWYFWNVGFSSLAFDDEDNIFYAGREDGDIDEIEGASVTTDFDGSITTTVNTPDRDGGDPMGRKLFLYARVDAEIATGDTMTAAFYTDDTLRQTFTITGDRTKKLLRLPSGSMGFTWRMEITFTGTNRLKLHGVEAQWKSLVSS